jgi:hypothetical protein
MTLDSGSYSLATIISFTISFLAGLPKSNTEKNSARRRRGSSQEKFNKFFEEDEDIHAFDSRGKTRQEDASKATPKLLVDKS